MASDNNIQSPERRLTTRSQSARSESSLPSSYSERPIQPSNRRSRVERDQLSNRASRSNDINSDDEEPSKQYFHI